MVSLEQQQQQQQQQLEGSKRTKQPASFDPETSPIPGQQAWVILDLNGTIVRSSVDRNSGFTHEIPPIVTDAKTLYAMLVESTPLVTEQHQGLKRMTINFGSLRYIVARDEHHIYLLQTKV